PSDLYTLSLHDALPIYPQRKTHRFELRRFQCLLQLGKMIARNGHQRRQLLAAGKTTARIADRQRVRAIGKTALGLDLEETGDITDRKSTRLNSSHVSIS